MSLDQQYRVRSTTLAAFQRVVAVHTAEYPDVGLLDFAAAMACGSHLTVASYPTDDALRILPSLARRCAESHGLGPPEFLLLTEPEVESAFATASDANADLLVMREPGRLARGTLKQAAPSVCFLPTGASPAVRRILAHVELNPEGRHVLKRTARLYRALGVQELFALQVYCSDAAYGHEADQFERRKNLLHFVHRASRRGVSYTPVLEESARPLRTLARVALERSADLVVIGRQLRASSRALCELTRECNAPVLQLRLPEFTLGARLRQIFSNPEPVFG